VLVDLANRVWRVEPIGLIGVLPTRCPDCNHPLQVAVAAGRLQPTEAVAQFAVAAKDWWRSISFT